MKLTRWVLVLACMACDPRQSPPTGQLLLYVDTDAIVPALFDRLLVDVYPPGADAPCKGCSRLFALDANAFNDRTVSIGIPEQPGVDGYRARLRMYAAASTASGQPPQSFPDGRPPPSVIDVTVALPPVATQGILERQVILETDKVGLPIGTLTNPVATLEGRPNSSRVGSWSHATRVPCKSGDVPGYVCIPGGAFWMGNARIIDPQWGGSVRRLVVLSPFYLKQDEVTVAEYRAANDPTVTEWSHKLVGDAYEDFCTYTAMPEKFEKLPINCVYASMARSYCQAQGGDLPTEAQYEYAASNLRSSLFVWGDRAGTCTDAVLGLGWGILGPTDCPNDLPASAPLVVGSQSFFRRADRLSISGSTVYDLVGNVCEWMRDTWNRQDEGCWSAGGIYFDPVCTGPSPRDGTRLSVRGGAWAQDARHAAAASRFSTPPAALSPTIGFRCARPD